MTTPQKSPLQQPETWSAIASGYAGIGLFDSYQQRALGAAGALAEKRVLDVACGPGALARAAAKQGAQVVAVDFAAGMVQELTRLAEAEQLSASIEARVMNAQALELNNDSFDAAFCMFGFMFFPNRAQAFGELLRVLKPGGVAVVMTWGPIERRPLMGVSFDAFGEALPELPRPQKGDLQLPEECVIEMSAVGFEDVTCEALHEDVRFNDVAHYAQVIEDTSGPLVLMRRRMGDAAWAEVRARFVEAARKRLPSSGPFTLGAEALLTRGVKPA